MNECKARDANQVMAPQNACHSLTLSPPPTRLTRRTNLRCLWCHVAYLNEAQCEAKAIISGNLIMNPHAIRNTTEVPAKWTLYFLCPCWLSNQISSANRRINLWYMQRTRIHDGRTNGRMNGRSPVQVIPLWGISYLQQEQQQQRYLYVSLWHGCEAHWTREKLKVIFHIVAQSKPMKLQVVWALNLCVLEKRAWVWVYFHL